MALYRTTDRKGKIAFPPIVICGDPEPSQPTNGHRRKSVTFAAEDTIIEPAPVITFLTPASRRGPWSIEMLRDWLIAEA